MRKLLLTMATAAAVLAAGSLANRADAMTAGNTAGLRAAIDDIAVMDQIHCRPGQLHHTFHRPSSRYRSWDGCYGEAPFVGAPPLIVAPPIIIGPGWGRGGWCHGRFSGNFRC